MPLSRPANANVTHDSNQFQRRQRGPWPVTAEQFEMVQYQFNWSLNGSLDAYLGEICHFGVFFRQSLKTHNLW